MERPLGVPEDGWNVAALPFSILWAAVFALAPLLMGTGWLCCAPAAPCPVPFPLEPAQLIGDCLPARLLGSPLSCCGYMQHRGN